MDKKIQIYMGRAGTGKTSACFARIREIMQADPKAKVILLAPDPITYKVERELVEFMPEDGFHSVQVVGFARLAYQIMQEKNAKEDNVLTDVGRNLILRNVLKENEKDLTVFKKAARQPHFANIIQAMIKECKAFGVDYKDLEEGAKAVKSSILQLKLEDLAILEKAYQEKLDERFINANDILTELLINIPSSDLVKDAHVFIDGYHWFTPQQLQVVKSLFNEAKESVLTLTLPADDYEKYKRKGSLFFRTWETYNDLLNLYGSNLTIKPFNVTQRANADLADNFFKSPAKIAQKDTKIPLIVANNQECEVDYICRRICHEVQENNRRFRDFAIVLRDTSVYADTFEKLLNRYEIPYFSDHRHVMNSHPLAELLEGVFALCEHKYGHDALFRVLKTDLFPLTREEVDELENYCLEYAKYEKAWTADEDWTNKRDLFVKEGEVDPQEERLVRVNASRRKVKEILDPFIEYGRTLHEGGSWANEVYNLLVTLKVQVSLSRWYKAEEEKGDLQEAKAHLQMYKRVIMLLEEIHTVAAEEKLNANDLWLLLEEGIQEVTYSIVPPTLDHVMVTSIERSYATEFPIVFVPGLNDGVFPRRMGDEGLLRDNERDELRAQGINLAGGALIQAFNENFLFYLACTRAKEQLILSYVNADSENKPLEAALVVRRLIQLGYCEPNVYVGSEIEKGQEQHYIWRPLQSLNLLAAKFLPLTQGEEVDSIWWALFNWGKVHKPSSVEKIMRGIYDENVMPLIDKDIIENLLLRNDAIAGSVTRLERYNACPFSFFSQYVLRLDERPIRQFSSPEIGTYLHENLRSIGEQLMAKNLNWHEISETDMNELIIQTSDEIAKETACGILDETAYSRNIKERLVMTLKKTIERLRTWSNRSSFKMMALEQDFGGFSENSWDALTIKTAQDKEVKLRGQIDRIDIWEKENETLGMIIDYKSGNQGIKAQDVYYGLKLQLLTYLLAFEEASSKDLLKSAKSKNVKAVSEALNVGTSADAGAMATTGIDNMPYLPAGLIYTFVQNPKISEKAPLTYEEAEVALEKEGLENTGYFSNNLEVLEGIDYLSTEQSTPFVPIKLKKDGEIQKTSQRKVKSVADFMNLMEYTKNQIAETGTDIIDGKFPIAPYRIAEKSPCMYCKYRTVCRFDLSQGDCKYRFLNPLSEEDAMKVIEEKIAAKNSDGEGSEIELSAATEGATNSEASSTKEVSAEAKKKATPKAKPSADNSETVSKEASVKTSKKTEPKTGAKAKKKATPKAKTNEETSAKSEVLEKEEGNK